MDMGDNETAVIQSTVFEENNGALTTANYIKMTRRTKHVGLKYH